MTGQGGFGRLSFDEITVDENPRPPSVGIPFRDQFDTLEIGGLERTARSSVVPRGHPSLRRHFQQGQLAAGRRYRA